MSEIDWKNKLRKIRETAQEAIPEDEKKPKVKFPWFGFCIAVAADSWDGVELLCNLITAGACLAFTETIGNIIDWATGAILLLWCLFYKNADTSLMLKIIAAMTGESVPGADPVPSWMGIIFWHYFHEKAQSKLGVKIPTKLSQATT